MARSTARVTAQLIAFTRAAAATEDCTVTDNSKTYASALSLAGETVSLIELRGILISTLCQSRAGRFCVPRKSNIFCYRHKTTVAGSLSLYVAVIKTVTVLFRFFASALAKHDVTRLPLTR